MRRLPALLASFALAVVAAPAAYGAPTGYVEIVADGPSYGTLDLPASARVDLARATFASASPYLVLVALRRGVPAFAVEREPGRAARVVPLTDSTSLPAGRSELRLLTRAKATIRFPVTGVRGTRVVRLTRRLAGAVVAERAAAPVANTVRSEIAVTPPARSIVLHGFYDSAAEITTGRAVRLCFEPAVACEEDHEIGPPEDAVSNTYWPEDRVGGRQTARLELTELGTPNPRLRHYVLVLPIG